MGYFDRDFAIDERILRQIHDRRVAFTELTFDLVFAEGEALKIAGIRGSHGQGRSILGEVLAQLSLREW